MIAFTIPGEPCAKQRPRFVRATGRAFTPAKTERYEGIIADHASRAMEGVAPVGGPVRIAIRATYLHPASWSKKKRAETEWKTSKPDADNIAKIVKDALNKIVFNDDAQVVDMHVQKKYGAVAGLTIYVEEIQRSHTSLAAGGAAEGGVTERASLTLAAT